jgi:hypothetical protein
MAGQWTVLQCVGVEDACGLVTPEGRYIQFGHGECTHSFDLALARRIVACLNLCAQLSDTQIQGLAAVPLFGEPTDATRP